jgi:hypothetical protein
LPWIFYYFKKKIKKGGLLMSFSDMLNKPLPSAASRMEMEDVNVPTDADLDRSDYKEPEVPDKIFASKNSTTDEYGCGDECGTDVRPAMPTIYSHEADDDDDDDVEDIDDIDVSDLSDEDLDRLEDALKNSDVEDVTINVVDDDDDDEDDTEVKLTPAEDKEADDMMSLAATTQLVQSELNDDEQKKFYESSIDAPVAVYEGFLLESDVEAYLNSEDDMFTESKRFYNKNVVRFTKQARMHQLYAIAVNVSARAHNDTMYNAYKKILRKRRILRAKLDKKYHNEAVKRMKVYIKRLSSSKSPVLNKIGKNLKK